MSTGTQGEWSMWTNSWLKLGTAMLLAALVTVGGHRPAQAQTVEELRNFYVRLIRKSEKVVLPATGADVWRVRADLDLPDDFDPNRKEIEIYITTPNNCPGCGGSAGGAFTDPANLHANPLLVRQLLPRRGGIWSMWLDVEDNGFCRVALAPRETKWNIRARCKGIQILPPFLDTLDFQVSIRVGDAIFFSAPHPFVQLKPTARRYH